MKPQEASKSSSSRSVMDRDVGRDAGVGRGFGLEYQVLEVHASGPEENGDEAEAGRRGERLTNVEEVEFSSASSSSISSLPSSSSSSLLPPSSPILPVCLEEEETVTGCARTFTGLRLFSRR